MSTDKWVFVYKRPMSASACQHFPDAFALISHPERSSAKAPFRQVNASVRPVQPLINMRKKTEGGASAQPVPQPFRPFARVNFQGRNIFNGFFRVPVNEKIPALNLI
ncbi:MAG: hypothetical protein WCC41_18615 [Rhodomicrobium sp.]